MKSRNEINSKDRWNVEALYPNTEAWEKSFNKIAREGESLRWPEIDTFRTRLHESPEVLKSALDLIISLDRMLTKLYIYAHLRHDEDITDDYHKSAFARIATTVHEFNQQVSWFDPELLEISTEKINEYLNSPALLDYRFHLEKIFRLKKHTLSAEGEELVALAAKPLESCYKSFCAISDADFKFGKIKDNGGKEHDLTHGQYGLYIRDHDRVLRQNAFQKYHNQYKSYENTLCELLSGQVNRNLFNTTARHYASCLEASLYPHQINTSVYHSLVRSVNDRLSSLHHYIKLRQKILGLEEIHLYDMYVPLTDQIDIRLSYEEAEDVIIASVAPLGAEYQNTLKNGLQNERWADRYENKNKRSGAYSSGCYDSMPYILMNYKGLLRDVFTLAHEAGHSMHSLLSRKAQPYQYSNYPIFVAEVASTFNEELLMQELLKRFTGKTEQIFLINQKIEDIRSTLFRQTMFAEFELKIHEMIEQGVPFTPKSLREIYRDLNVKYFSNHVVIDSEIEIEWARIPHFYYNFYVYQYATGISAALALSENVLKGGKNEREAYLNFLQSGGSHYPLDLLRIAGVDMSSSAPVNAAISKFDKLVSNLSQLKGVQLDSLNHDDQAVISSKKN